MPEIFRPDRLPHEFADTGLALRSQCGEPNRNPGTPPQGLISAKCGTVTMSHNWGKGDSEYTSIYWLAKLCFSALFAVLRDPE